MQGRGDVETILCSCVACWTRWLTNKPRERLSPGVSVCLGKGRGVEEEESEG